MSPDEADALVMKWVRQVLSKASKILEKYISGDLAANNRNSFFTPPRSESTKSKRAAAMCQLQSEAVTAAYTIGSLVTVCPSADVSSIVPILHSIITSGNSDPKLSKLPGSTVNMKQKALSLYIHAWLTMGKICLADGKLAKSYIPLFVQVCFNNHFISFIWETSKKHNNVLLDVYERISICCMIAEHFAAIRISIFFFQIELFATLFADSF